MLKHMLTWRCNRGCSYCITRGVRTKVNEDLERTRDTYRSLRARGHVEIMLTGGEPTLYPYFWPLLAHAAECFRAVHITTQEADILADSPAGTLARDILTSVVFSLHDTPLEKIPEVGTFRWRKTQDSCKVYAAILDTQWHPELPSVLYQSGFDGLTVNEEQRSTDTFPEERLMAYNPAPYFNIQTRDLLFSMRLNKRGKCMDETIILPDLQVINDFTPYL